MLSVRIKEHPRKEVDILIIFKVPKIAIKKIAIDTTKWSQKLHKYFVCCSKS
jgi:hypothetical protein